MPGQHPSIIDPTRREALTAGGATLGMLAAYTDPARAAECVLTSRQIDGPYHIPGTAERRDVRSGKPGVDLVLRLRVVDASHCEAIAGVATEIWSCDALGNYSGHPDVDPNVPPRFGGRESGLGGGPGRPTAGQGRPGAVRGGGHREPTGPQRFLRGWQSANAEGEVEFLTIYPGWYNPRAVHVHLKVHLGGTELLTTQIYFPDDLTDSIHRTEAYSARYPTPIPNSKDRVKYWGLQGNEPTGVFPEMTREGKTQIGTLTIGIQRA